jgi:hypothetical protein
MNKNLLSTFAAVASLTVALTSCSTDDTPAPVIDGELVDVQITAAVAQQLSRAVADGTNVNEITYAVYAGDYASDEIGDPLSVFTTADGAAAAQMTDEMNGLSYSLQVQLAKGKTYTIVFWADKQTDGTSPYTFSAADKTVTVSYDDALANDTSRDAFFGVTTLTAGEVAQTPVTLTRQLALVNLATNDSTAYANSGFAYTKSALTVDHVANTFNFLSKNGKFTGDVKATFALNDLTADKFHISGYSYLGYAFVLPGESTVDVSYSIAATDDTEATEINTITAVPVKANYRTNVYGALLTTKYNVSTTITPDFEGDEDFEIWDGVTVTEPEINDETQEVIVDSPSDLIGLIELINGTSSTKGVRSRAATSIPEGYTIKLTASFDFGGREITPIANGVKRNGSAISTATTATPFTGVIDGQGHTLKNFTITSTVNDAAIANGFIAGLSGEGAKLCNINFSGIKISTAYGEQTAIVGIVEKGATVDNVHVLSGEISGTQAVAGIVGRVLKYGNITNCSNAATITSTRNNVGGIAGAAYYTEENRRMYITNCVNSGAIKAGNSTAGGIVGFSCANVSYCTNSGTVTATATASSVGGVIGEQQNYGSVTNCYNTADVSNTATTISDYGTGGVIGWIRYIGAPASYSAKEKIVVSECSNSGSVKAGTSGVGGIVGVWNNWGTIENCTNSAPILSGAQWVAGIVGGQQDIDTDNNPDFGEKMIYVNNCTSSTPLDCMTNPDGNTSVLKAEIIYVNTNGHVTIDDTVK